MKINDVVVSIPIPECLNAFGNVAIYSSMRLGCCQLLEIGPLSDDSTLNPFETL